MQLSNKNLYKVSLSKSIFGISKRSRTLILLYSLEAILDLVCLWHSNFSKTSANHEYHEKPPR